MPPKSKRSKTIVTSKENVFVSIKSKPKIVPKNTNFLRKALSDKTNSASDDDPLTSPKLLRTRGTLNIIKNVSGKNQNNDKLTSRQNKNMAKKTEGINPEKILDKCGASQNRLVVVISPLKMVERNIADSRPKRICRLPSKFEDHSVSPSKYIPVQPIQASTPVVKNNELKISTKVVSMKERVQKERNVQTQQNKVRNLVSSQEIKGNNINNSTIQKPKERNIRPEKLSQNKNVTQKQQKRLKSTGSSKKQADSNNNANDSKENKICDISLSCNEKLDKVATLNKKCSSKGFVKNGKGLKRDASSLDVYEFTYDPTEEPPPQKKKRKRAAQKKQEKSKPVFTMNYDKNVTKSLANLKKILSTKAQSKSQTIHTAPNLQAKSKQCAIASNVNNVIENNTEKNGFHQNFNSFHVEDIVLNNEAVANDHDDINYSPVNSPNQIRQPSEPRSDCTREAEAKVTNNDPLNLQDDLSFFDDQPAASSSINVSVRNPSATPWRAEFEQLPIKWQVNTYVKPNMTPAFESSFIDFNNKKKHVYTNLVPEQDAVLPEIVENESSSKFKQTSIISFFKEVVERNEKKKSKLKSTPVKENSLFEDISHTSFISPIKQNAKSTINRNVTPKKNKSSEHADDIVNSTDICSQNKSPLISKQSRNLRSKNNDKDVTFFGFDESEEQDQENVSPIKKIDKHRAKALRSRTRAILQEFNMQTRPTRVVSVMTANNKAVNVNKFVHENKQNDLDTQEKGFEDSVMGGEADNVVTTNINNSNLNTEDSQSVHLFEDLELVHHLKPTRKSYGKSKKVTFRHNSESSDIEDNASDHDGSSLEEDNLDDLTFHMPSLKPKKSRKKKMTAKKQHSKKEEKEAEAWAAGFNSMCEDVDQFDLIVE